MKNLSIILAICTAFICGAFFTYYLKKEKTIIVKQAYCEDGKCLSDENAYFIQESIEDAYNNIINLKSDNPYLIKVENNLRNIELLLNE